VNIVRKRFVGLPVYVYTGVRVPGSIEKKAADSAIVRYMYEEINPRKHLITAPRYRWHVLPLCKLPGHSEIIGHVNVYKM